MQDRTIDNALLALRRQIIRGDGENLAHVEALLRARGVRMPRVLPHQRELVARQGEVRHIVLTALKDRPMRLAEIAELIAETRGETDNKAHRNRTAQCLHKMKLAGLVRREGRVWRV